MSWAPQPDFLQQLVGLLNGVASGSNAYHRELRERLEQLSSVADIDSYYMFVFLHMPQENPTVRATAGLLLKNNVRKSYGVMNQQVKSYIKQNCIVGLCDPDSLVRRTVGTLITTIHSVGQDWPELIPTLVNYIANPADPHILESALSTLAKICEDSASQMSPQTAATLIPIFLQFFEHSAPKIRQVAITATNQFLTVRDGVVPRVHPALLENINQYIQGLYNHATDAVPAVRRLVCQGLVLLIEMEPQPLLPQLETIIQYMLHSTSDPDSSVALEACDFWMAVCEIDEAHGYLEAVLPRLVPILVRGMIYDDDDSALLRADEEDFAEQDRQEDVRPIFHHTRMQGAGSSAAPDDDDDDDEAQDDEDEDGGDGKDDDSFGEWNFRKCSAAGLDQLSSVFKESLLPHVLPLIEPLLNSQDWKERECGILVLGAIAEGCAQALEPHLPQMFMYMLNMMQDAKPLVRCIACWSLSRYAEWSVRQQTDQYLQPLLQQLLQTMWDRKKRVQEAACSALGTLEEIALDRLVPYIEPILRHIAGAFSMYKNKNLLILYDTTTQLANAVGSSLNNPTYVQLLMSPLQEKWNALSDDDMNLFPLLECLASLATVLGLGFQPYAPDVFNRCTRIIQTCFDKEKLYLLDPINHDEVNKDFVIVGLDLLSGVVEGLKKSVESLLAAHGELVPLLFQCVNDDVAEVRQSAFALLGDLTSACFAFVEPHVGNLFSYLEVNLTPEHVSTCNNAAWAIGEIALQLGNRMDPFAERALPRLMAILQTDRVNIPLTLLENIAIAIGRLGKVSPNVVAPHLMTFLENWSKYIKVIRDNAEKESAFHGICNCIERNPQGAVPSFMYLCDAFASWTAPPDDLAARINGLLTSFKNSAGPQWNAFFANSQPTLQRLTALYRL